MRIIRVFPRRNKATPNDPLSFVGDPGLFVPEADEIHVSATFLEDLPEAERLARSWGRLGMPVKIGGPATGQAGEDFTPGRYLRFGYVITSRGCPNKCWFCFAWKRDGVEIKELPVTEGWILQDDNILACSDQHRRSVFAMLKQSSKKYKQPVQFTGGLEATRLTREIALELKQLRPKQLFFAYDSPADRDALFTAGELLTAAGFSFAGHSLRAYVLIGYPGDTVALAAGRLEDAVRAGFIPMAMLYSDGKRYASPDWRKLQKYWARPAYIARAIREQEDGRRAA